MKSIIISSCLLFYCYAGAQSNKTSYPKDSVIKAQIIDPFEKAAADKGTDPDWPELTSIIRSKYDSSFADRLTNKAQIFYYWGKDWPAFTKALVRYTDKYEDPNNLPLLNKNARMVLQFSDDIISLQAALSWSKKTIEREPGNEDYKKTYNELSEKIRNK
jgi:hypothetical protein